MPLRACMSYFNCFVSNKCIVLTDALKAMTTLLKDIKSEIHIFSCSFCNHKIHTFTWEYLHEKLPKKISNSYESTWHLSKLKSWKTFAFYIDGEVLYKNKQIRNHVFRFSCQLKKVTDNFLRNYCVSASTFGFE